MTDESHERSGVLLLRVWSETGSPDDLRFRVVVAEPPASPRVLGPGVGLGGLCAVVTAWVDELLARP